MRGRGTRKPCPGCGQVKSYRPAAEVCGECRQDLELARAVHGRRLREASGENGKRAFRIAEPGWAHFYPYVYCGQGGGDAGGRFRDAFDALVTALAEPITWDDLPERIDEDGTEHLDKGIERLVGGDRDYEQHEPALLPQAAGLALRELYAAVQAVSAEALENGRGEGRQLLVGLATGRLSVGEFNKKTTDADEGGSQW